MENECHTFGVLILRVQCYKWQNCEKSHVCNFLALPHGFCLKKSRGRRGRTRCRRRAATAPTAATMHPMPPFFRDRTRQRRRRRHRTQPRAPLSRQHRATATAFQPELNTLNLTPPWMRIREQRGGDHGGPAVSHRIHALSISGAFFRVGREIPCCSALME
jgi:hypothetical protein